MRSYVLPILMVLTLISYAGKYDSLRISTGRVASLDSMMAANRAASDSLDAYMARTEAELNPPPRALDKVQGMGVWIALVISLVLSASAKLRPRIRWLLTLAIVWGVFVVILLGNPHGALVPGISEMFGAAIVSTVLGLLIHEAILWMVRRTKRNPA